MGRVTKTAICTFSLVLKHWKRGGAALDPALALNAKLMPDWVLDVINSVGSAPLDSTSWTGQLLAALPWAGRTGASNQPCLDVAAAVLN